MFYCRKRWVINKQSHWLHKQKSVPMRFNKQFAAYRVNTSY